MTTYTNTMRLPCCCPIPCSCQTPDEPTRCGCTRHCWEPADDIAAALAAEADRFSRALSGRVQHKTPTACPVCGARRALAAGEDFPTHPDLRAAHVGRLQWCSYAYGVTAGPITGQEA